MMTDVFSPPVEPSINSSRKITMRTLENNFGDGYVQRSGDGINTRGETWQAEWQALTQEQADEIEAFFEAHLGYISFFWQAPKASFAQKYRCREWQRGFPSGNLVSISATLEMVFDL